MVIIIGQHQLITEGITDFIPENIAVKHIVLNPRGQVNIHSEIFSRQNLIIINMDGIHKEALSLIKTCKTLFHKTKIIAVDTHNSSSMTKHLLQIGASAYLPLNAKAERISKVIKELLFDTEQIGS